MFRGILRLRSIREGDFHGMDVHWIDSWLSLKVKNGTILKTASRYGRLPSPRLLL